MSPSGQDFTMTDTNTAPILNHPAPTPIAKTHTRLTETVDYAVTQALRECAFGERITWETGLLLVPNQQGQLSPAIAIYINMPAPILGEFCVEMQCLDPHQATAANVTQAVTEMVGRLFETRARMSAVNN